MIEELSLAEVGNLSMTLGIHRISCTEDCPDRLRLSVGYATYVASTHVEETGHACIVSPLEGTDRTIVDERTASDAARSTAGQSDRSEGVSPGRSSKPATPLAGDIEPE